MDKESRGIAWLGHIYQKLEAVLVEVDNFAAQNSVRVSGEGMVSPRNPNDAQGLGFVSDEPKEIMEKCSSGAIDMQRSHGDSVENLDISKCILSDERVDGNDSNEKLSDTVLSDEETLCRVPLPEESIGKNNETGVTALGLARPVSLQDIDRSVSDDSQSTEAQLICSSSGRVRTEVPCNDSNVVCSSGHTLVDSNLVQVVTETPAVLVEEDMPKKRATGDNYIAPIGNEDFCNDDAAPLETIELYDMADREELSPVDDAMLYAVYRRTRKLRSFKKKIVDALAPKRQREREYEQLAIWFGDASMVSGLDTTATTKRPLASEEDSDWELL